MQVCARRDGEDEGDGEKKIYTQERGREKKREREVSYLLSETNHIKSTRAVKSREGEEEKKK